jgi:type VI secretion system protein VasJ
VVLEKFSDDAPVLSDVRRALEEAKRVASDLAAPRAAPQPSAPSAASAAGSAPAAAVAIDSPDAALRVLVTAGNDVKRAAVFLIQKDPSSPVPYLVTRGIVWGMVRDLPPHTDGVTPFPAPDPNLTVAWTAMADAGNWQALLVEAEQRLFGNPLWLDINRFVVRALEGLGHSAAHRAVVDMTLALARRLPGLVELSFQGGETPFASEETRAWLAAEARAAGGEPALAIGATPPAAAGDADEAAFLAAVQDAKGLASRKKIVDAVKLIQERSQSAPSPRVRFRYRAALAGICLEAGQHAVASAQYDALLDEMERHALDEWEPDLSREVLEGSYICEKRLSLNGQRNGPDSQARLGKLYARLCRIDLLSALALEKKK